MFHEMTLKLYFMKCLKEKFHSVSFPLEISLNSQENTCAKISFLMKLQACNFIKKETLEQVFFCVFCEIPNDTFFTEDLRWLLLHRDKWETLGQI